MALFLRHVDLLASWTEDLDPGGPNFLTHTDRKNMLSFTQNPRTDTKDSFEKLLLHHGESFRCEYKPGMNQSINISSFLIYGKVSEDYEFSYLSSSSY